MSFILTSFSCALSPPPSLAPSTVGNIPYGMSEEMLADLFAEVGPVKTSR